MACKQAVGRFLLVLIFIASGLAKLSDPAPQQAHMNSNYKANVEFYSKYGITLPSAALISEFSKGIIMTMGGVMLVAALLTLFNLKYGPCILVAQMVLITVMMHNPMIASNSQEAQLQLVNALKNLAIIGGLMQVCCQHCGECKTETVTAEKPKKKVD